MFNKKNPKIRLSTSSLEWSETAQKHLLVGASWQSIVTSGGRDDAIKLAKKLSATHYYYKSLGAAFAKIEAEKGKEPAGHFLASIIFASKGDSSAIALLKISEDRLWFCVVNSQRVVVDEVISGDELAAFERVRELADETSYVVYTDLDGHGIESTYLSLDSLAQDVADGSLAAMILPIARTDFKFSKNAIYLVVILATGVLAVKAWDFYKTKKAKEAIDLAASQEESAEQAWDKAITEFQKTTSSATGQGWLNVRNSIGQIPFSWLGWNLVSATCNSQFFASENKKQWSCSANYSSEPFAANNQKLAASFLKNLPITYRLEFLPLQGAKLHWSVDEGVKAFDLKEIPRKQFHLESTASALQYLLPALSQPIDIAWNPLEVAAPKNKKGEAFPTDARVANLIQANMNVSGPLRTVDSTFSKSLSVDWRKISLIATKDSKPSLTTSSLFASAEGVVYAIK